MVDEIAGYVNDTNSLLKCASLLKVVDDEEGCQIILDRIVSMPHGNDKFTVAMSLRGLGRPDDAYEMIKDIEENDDMLFEKAGTLLMMDEAEEALAKLKKIISMRSEHNILMAEVLCALGEFDEAYVISSKLVSNENASYVSLVNLCTTLMMMGKNKDAVRTARKYLKEGKDADSLALAAYVMRINGRMSAAANFAHRAITKDHTHKGALETMAFCLIEKSKFTEAKVFAGAINERSPGDPAVIRILDACRMASK
jgi:tetratricopeptide (TPR) repeat protein